MPHHPRLWNYSANKYVEDVGGQAAANVLCECADDGSQDENARSVPTHHEKVYMSKKKGLTYGNCSTATKSKNNQQWAGC